MAEIKPFQPLTREDVAGILGVTVHTLENHIAAGLLPAPATLRGRRYWHPDLFYAWLDDTLRRPNHAPPGAAGPEQETKERVAPMNAGAGASRGKRSSSGNPGAAVERAQAREREKLKALQGDASGN